MSTTDKINAMDAKQLRLFRVLQRAHKELGKNVAMFADNWRMPKEEIHNYVIENFDIDLNNL